MTADEKQMIAALLLSAATPEQMPAIPPRPKSYLCRPAGGPIQIDGKLDEPAWQRAPFTEDFVDIEGNLKPTPRFRTRVKMLWDSANLYIGAEIQEPHVRATLTQHDSVIFRDNDFEVFLDANGEGEYYVELEVNALNTTWDLLLPHPYRGGGPALNGWDIKGLRTAVSIQGSLNSSTQTSHGWTVEIAIPWKALAEFCRRPLPPREGDQWRINFSRVEWPTFLSAAGYETVPGSHEDNWVWSPQWIVDMHRPDRWGVLQFAGESDLETGISPLAGWRQSQILFSVWDAEAAFRRRTGHYSANVGELALPIAPSGLWATPDQFEASYEGYRINDRLRIWKQP